MRADAGAGAQRADISSVAGHLGLANRQPKINSYESHQSYNETQHDEESRVPAPEGTPRGD